MAVAEYLIEEDATAVELVPLDKTELKDWLAGQTETRRGWVQSVGFAAEAGAVCLLPGADGRLGSVLFGLAEDDDPWAFAPLPAKLYEPGTPGLGLIRQNLDLAQFREQSGLALAQFTIRQTGPPSEGLRRDWPEVALGLEKHNGYAFQWFAMSALVAGLYLWFQFFRRSAAPIKESLNHVPPPRL